MKKEKEKTISSQIRGKSPTKRGLMSSMREIKFDQNNTQDKSMMNSSIISNSELFQPQYFQNQKGPANQFDHENDDDSKMDDPSFQQLKKHRETKRHHVDDEGGYSPEVQNKSFLNKYNFSLPKPQYENEKFDEFDETTSMIKLVSKEIIKNYYFLMFLMILPPLSYILFFVPNIVLTLLYIFNIIEYSLFSRSVILYMVILILLITLMNFYNYYKYKQIKIQSNEQDNQLNKQFNLAEQKQLINQKNIMKILGLNLLSIFCLLDTGYDIIFVLLTYGSGRLWLVILVCVCYIFTFCDKIYNVKRLLTLSKNQRNQKSERNILTDPEYQITYFSSCISIEMFTLAEIINCSSIKIIGKVRRIIIFNGVHVVIQKILFLIFKVIYVSLEIKNKSRLIVFAIPMNAISALLTLGYSFYKYKQIERQKQLSQDPMARKKFITGIFQSTIKYKQLAKGNICNLERVINEIETIRKSYNQQNEIAIKNIDKIKVKLINGDQQSFETFIEILKEQHFIREVSFYKMKFTTQKDFENLSEILILRKNGVLKVSFKDCYFKEGYMKFITNKLSQQDQFLVNDLEFQIRVNENTDYTTIFQVLKTIVQKWKIYALFQPLYYKKETKSLIQKLKENRLLGLSQFWPQTIIIENQQIKNYYQQLRVSKEENLQNKGNLIFFKDRNLQNLYEQVLYNNMRKLDISMARDIFTHSFHKERFIENLLRAIEINHDITNLKVRIIHDHSIYDKLEYFQIKLSHFQRLWKNIPQNQLIKLELNLSQMVTQDTDSLEILYSNLEGIINKNILSLKELTFTGALFDYYVKPQKKFYLKLRHLTLKKLALNNCKFLCDDAFEHFFLNLSETHNSIKILQINRLNSIVSAQGFDKFILSQQESLEELTLIKVHKNIFSKKYHNRVLQSFTKLANLKKLSLQINFLDNHRIKPLIEKMNKQSFQELMYLNLSNNKLNDDSMIVIEKLLKYRTFSLQQLNLSNNMVNEEGLNLIMNSTTNIGDFMLIKELIVNDMQRKNYLINNHKVPQLERLQLKKSMAIGLDQNTFITGFQTLGNLTNTLQYLDISYCQFSQFQIHSMIQQYFLTDNCILKSLNLSGQKIDEPNVDMFEKYLEKTKTLQTLIMNDCYLQDSITSKLLMTCFSNLKINGELSFQKNNLNDQLFFNILEENGEDSARLQYKKQHQIMKIDLSQNQIGDESISDMVKVIKKYNIQINQINLSKNKIEKDGLYTIRNFLQECPNLSFEILDISENSLQLLKSATILEMRSPTTEVTNIIYTAKVQKIKKDKKGEKRAKK